jgi:hypothetical protein
MSSTVLQATLAFLFSVCGCLPGETPFEPLPLQVIQQEPWHFVILQQGPTSQSPATP